MKKNSFFIVFIFLISFFFFSNIFAFDSLTRVQLRTSYQQFEKCMERSSNDVTECINEFNKAVMIYKNAFKKEPSNEDVKSKLLLLVNAMNDIGETYYSAAEKKKGIDPSLSQKYYEKASICYKQLIELYPSKKEFKDLLKKANYLSKYEEVEGYIFELKNRKRIDYASLTLQSLKSTHDAFIATFGRNEKLNEDVEQVIGQFASKVKQLFDATVKERDPDKMNLLIYLMKAQSKIADTDDKKQYRTILAYMESEIIKIINEMVKTYSLDLEKSEKNLNNGKFSEAEIGFKNLLSKTNLFPDYSSADKSLQIRISKATNNFNLHQFRNDLQQKIELTENTNNFLSILETGENAFNKSDWISSYTIFRKAMDFAKGKQLGVQNDIAKNWLMKTQKKIHSLKENEIDTRELADLYYEPISYESWLRLAKEGEFSKEFVSLSGKFQQKVGDIVILKDSTLEFDFFLEQVFVGEKMNSMALIFKKDRLLREDDYISCIGKYNDIERFQGILGNEIQIPVFNVIWISM